MLPARRFRATLLGTTLGVALGAALTATGVAQADEKEWSVAITPGYALAYVDSRSASGGGGGIDVGYGVTESLAVHASTFESWNALPRSATKAAGTMSAFSAMAGLSYTFDVIRLVPIVDVQVGALGVRGSPGFGARSAVVPSSTGFAVAVGFGIDYLLTRHVALGVYAQYHALVTDLSRLPAYLYVGPRLTFRFGG